MGANLAGLEYAAGSSPPESFTMTQTRFLIWILALLALAGAVVGAAQCARPLARWKVEGRRARLDAAAELNRQIASRERHATVTATK